MEDTMEDVRIFEIPEHNMKLLEDKIKKLNKKAEKLGCEPITIELVEITTKEVIDPQVQMEIDNAPIERIAGLDWDSLPKIKVPVHRIIIHGDAPKLNGWRFVATVNHLEEGNLIKTVPDFEFSEFAREQINNEYRTAEPWCEHCRTVRPRIDTYLVWSDDEQEMVQLGSSCLKDFLGHPNPEMYARWFESISDLADLAGSLENIDSDYFGGGGIRYYDIEEYLDWVASSIRNDGWVSRGEARNSYEPVMATADRAMSAMIPNRYNMDEHRRLQPTDEDRKLAQEALEWVREFTTEKIADSDYLWNLFVSCKRDVVDHRTTGIVASVVSALLREKEREIKRAIRAKAEKDSDYFGEVKKREVFTLTLTGINYIEGEYGTTILYSFMDENGNIAKWFSSRSHSVSIGDKWEVKATVKDHQEYNGVKQTLITRGEFLKCLEDADAD